MSAEDLTPTRTMAAPVEGLAYAGKYRIVGAIGKGGMGVVLRAVDEELQRTVALKFLPAEFAGDPAAEARFLREARAVSALDHVNIGVIFGVEETADHRRFLVMAYYNGQNLSERLRSAAVGLAEDEALDIALQTARGLEAAHAAGVVHRDIKPSNLLLSRQGGVKIVDFGLARMHESDKVTHSGHALGTPAYMSPEQALARPVDHRTDLWSLGVVLGEMLAGRPVFQSDTVPGLLYEIVHGGPPALPKVAEPMRRVLEKALQRDPAERYASAAEMVADLEALRRDGPAAVVRGPSAVTRVSRLRRAKVGAAVVLLLSGVSGTGLFLWSRRQPAPMQDRGPSAGSAHDRYTKAVELCARWDRSGNLDKAVSLLEEATREDPGFALAFARLAEAQRMRYALTQRKEFRDSAVANAARALQLNPNLATVQVIYGRVLSTEGRHDLAEAAYQKALTLDQNNVEAYASFGRYYERLGRLDDAEAALRRALALEPDSMTVHDSFANFCFRRGRFAEAAAQWQEVIRLAPDNNAALVNLGGALIESGEPDKAIQALTEAARQKPGYMVWNNLGAAYSVGKRYPEAIEAWKKALTFQDTDPLVWGNLGTVYARINRQPESAEALKRAIEFGESNRKTQLRNADLHADLGLWYARLGKAAVARQRISTALTLAPADGRVAAAAAESSLLLGERGAALHHLRTAIGLGYPKKRIVANPELASLVTALR